MRATLFLALTIAASPAVNAQYYYKDVIASHETMLQFRQLKVNSIKSVKLSSFEADGSITEGFSGQQTVSTDYKTVTTDLSAPIGGSSQMINTYDENGQLMQTRDTTDGSGSVSDYFYNPKGLLSRIVNLSTSGGQRQEKEEHIWQYDDAGKPTMLYRVKNGIDTTFVTFGFDDQGMVAEEIALHKGQKKPSIYYYYDEKNRLTDVASYSEKARRILPSYVFEYNSNGKLLSMMVVPEGSDQYQRWVYEYNSKGLKIRETAFDKRKAIQGKIEYSYK